MSHHLAQLNVGRLRYPLDDERNSEFVEGLGPINEMAERHPGFVWRLTDDSGLPSSYVSVKDDPLFVINLSVWESGEALHDFVFKTDHRGFLRRRRHWFEAPTETVAVCWWVRAGHKPTVEEAMDCLRRLGRDGPDDEVFGFRPPYPPPPPPHDAPPSQAG